VIRFANVYKEYARTGAALNDVSFSVGKGEFVFLTGPSGAGKSSILKLIYMDELPTRGDVWVSGTRSRGVKRREISMLRRRLGVVFQDFASSRTAPLKPTSRLRSK
jgi:cell division transport system ATP-binding protein